jgi:hypothetical protein
VRADAEFDILMAQRSDLSFHEMRAGDAPDIRQSATAASRYQDRGHDTVTRNPRTLNLEPRTLNVTAARAGRVNAFETT